MISLEAALTALKKEGATHYTAPDQTTIRAYRPAPAYPGTHGCKIAVASDGIYGTCTLEDATEWYMGSPWTLWGDLPDDALPIGGNDAR